MLINEIFARSILNKSGISGVDYVVNPYLGCAHGCIYCYASFMKRFSGHREPWGQFVDIKVNAPEILAHQLRGHPSGLVSLSTVTDPYQPLERKHELTRRCLETLSQSPRLEVSILTKSGLALRDIDLFRRFESITVGFTITSPSDETSRRFEPGAPPTSHRLEALRRLQEEGVRTRVFFGPVIPYFSDSDEALRRLFEKLARARVGKVTVDKMNFYPSVQARVLEFLRQRNPEALDYVREVLLDEYPYVQELTYRVRHWAARFDLPCEIIFYRKSPFGAGELKEEKWSHPRVPSGW